MNPSRSARAEDTENTGSVSGRTPVTLVLFSRATVRGRVLRRLMGMVFSALGSTTTAPWEAALLPREKGSTARSAWSRG